jgi:isocitrate lyase
MVFEPKGEEERLRKKCRALISFLERADRKWLEESAPKLTREEISHQLRTGQGESAKRKFWGKWRRAHARPDGEDDISGMLQAFILTKALISAGAAIVEFEDQQSWQQEPGQVRKEVLEPTCELIEKITAGRFAADVCGARTVFLASTFAKSARLLLSDADWRDRQFIYGERSAEGYFQFCGGLDAAIARGLASAPYADLVCFESSTADLAEARKFAENVLAHFPKQLLAYDCSPLIKENRLDDAGIERFRNELGGMGYVLQFTTLGGFRSLNRSMS